MSPLIPASNENEYLATSLARVVVFVQVTTGVAAVYFPLPDSDDKRRWWQYVHPFIIPSMYEWRDRIPEPQMLSRKRKGRGLHCWSRYLFPRCHNSSVVGRTVWDSEFDAHFCTFSWACRLCGEVVPSCLQRQRAPVDIRGIDVSRHQRRHASCSCTARIRDAFIEAQHSSQVATQFNGAVKIRMFVQSHRYLTIRVGKFGEQRFVTLQRYLLALFEVHGFNKGAYLSVVMQRKVYNANSCSVYV